MSGMILPDWDWGTEGNKKLAELFTSQEQKDFFCDYLIYEINVDVLVAYMLRYTPIQELKKIALDIGAYNIDEDGEA